VEATIDSTIPRTTYYGAMALRACTSARFSAFPLVPFVVIVRAETRRAGFERCLKNMGARDGSTPDYTCLSLVFGLIRSWT
jgi:hypothetical protein